MTRTGSSRPAGRELATTRLQLARAYLQAAREGIALLDGASVANPVMSQIVLSAIAYTDAITALRSGRVNQQDHGGAVAALRNAVGERLPRAKETALRTILEDKNAVQYGARIKTQTEAAAMFRRLEDFAAWAESELAS